uniref:ATP-binding cassette sub-family E member 1 n=1 Tax=Lygus hesperus TaxID=30085 RepID=A0A0A9XY58_LYGHE
MPFSVREGINVFLEGYIRTENLRFRDVELTFKIAERAKDYELKQHYVQKYPRMTKTFSTFQLTIEPGEFSESEIIVLLGQNGTGKTTFMRILAGLEKPDTDVNLSR